MRSLLLSILGLFVASATPAATQIVSGGGQLLGALDVNVGGSLFNVNFLDGSCTQLYDGCDEASDFVFNTQGGALAASQALLTQVLVDTGQGNFDSEPDLTSGCSAPTCSVYTPYQPIGEFVLWGAAFNLPLGDPDSLGIILGSRTGDLSLSAAAVYAVWSPVPEPSTALLLALGLVGIGARRRG